MSKIDLVDKTVKLLVVDDHQVTRGMIKTILRGVGFVNVFTADSGSLAMEVIEKENIEMVVCDWNMPNGSGLDLLRELRADEKYKQLPFIMLTAEAYKENITEAIKAGVSEYIAKPFTSDVLINKVANVWFRKKSGARQHVEGEGDETETEGTPET